MHAHRLRSCEIPVSMHPRLTGESSISSTESAYYMIKVLLAIFVGLFRSRPAVKETSVAHDSGAPVHAGPAEAIPAVRAA